MNILIAPDKFKGSLAAPQVVAALSRGILRAMPDAVLTAKPIADGGEGFVHALSSRVTELPVSDALGRDVMAEYGWLNETTAILEMSAASGLWRIAQEERDPLRASTFGTGMLIRDAIERGAHTILVGLGGSATNDGGAGMAAALGYRFLTADGLTVEPIPVNYCRIASIEPPASPNFPRIIAACDVNNPLLGQHGATRVYGQQKGATPADLEVLENALEHLANTVAKDLKHDFRTVPGAGAAGGLGFGLLSFCGAEIQPGFDLVAEFVALEEAIAASDLVITGEGKIDAQTLHGKGPAGVAALARKHGKRVIAFAGVHDNAGSPECAQVFDAVFAIARPDISIEESIRNAATLLESAAEEVAKKIAAGGFK